MGRRAQEPVTSSFSASLNDVIGTRVRHRHDGCRPTEAFAIFYLLSIGDGGRGQRLESIAVSGDKAVVGLPAAPDDFNWKEPDCRRDYADAARSDLEELAFMRAARVVGTTSY